MWRAIVSATRNPRVLILFTVTTTAVGYAIGKVSEIATSAASEKTKDDMEQKVRKDFETARYASHSKNALAVMFDSIKPENAHGEDNVNAKHKKHPIKLPGVMWHPAVAKREEAAKIAREAAATEDMPAASRPTQTSQLGPFSKPEEG